MDPLADHLARFDYAAVPLRRGPTGHLSIAAVLDGAPACFYLDTGAGRTVLDLACARGRGLALTSDTPAASGLGTATMVTHRAPVRTFELGGVTEIDFLATVIDLSHVNQGLRARGAETMDGVLGADILEAREAVIDYKRLQLYLKRGTGQRAA
ncbi:MAG TPA: retropepsin-like aspartic protease [Candidatus Didemnitutus sp.]|nr:retropepsin-like aspartic protease [Candidatus Didemnitutus sp.]